jgi:hypothetical protein
MKLLSAFWRYWKWLCVALMTSFVLLAIVAAIVHVVKTPSQDRGVIDACIDNGGTWDAGAGLCKAPA